MEILEKHSKYLKEVSRDLSDHLARKTKTICK